ncbi:hypothetical protein BC829DRAFT_169481 [Chytridium lagenaria]|nr:hypothetical protein BC829DRAFT_169481 [Chytridium lagenaria]
MEDIAKMFQVGFIYNRQRGTPFIDDVPPLPSIPLIFQFDQRPTGLTLTLITSHIHPKTTQALTSHYIHLLTSLLTTPTPLGDATMLTESEIQHIVAYNNPANPESGTLWKRFDDVAERFPMNVAVVSVNGNTHTYEDVRRASNQLAREFLRRSGKRLDGRGVMCLLPRSAGWVITQIAIFKVGAFCVPVDPFDGGWWMWMLGWW